MTELEKQILDELVAMDNAVAGMRNGGQKVNLLPMFERLDNLAASLPRGGDPELAHFLQRKSYEKARLLLQGRGAENARGACGH
jgi:hypothetical protein